MKKAKICCVRCARWFLRARNSCVLAFDPSSLGAEPKRQRGKGATKTDATRAAGDLSQRVDETKNNDETSLGAPADKTLVTGLRFLSSKATTRILLELSQESKYEIRRLKEDPGKGIPPRIYIDILGAKTGACIDGIRCLPTTACCARFVSANIAPMWCALSSICKASARTTHFSLRIRTVWSSSFRGKKARSEC